MPAYGFVWLTWLLQNMSTRLMPLMEGKVVIEKTGDGETKNFLNSFSGFLQCIGWIPLGFFCGGKSAQNHYGSYGGEGCNREDRRWRNYKLSSVSQAFVFFVERCMQYHYYQTLPNLSWKCSNIAVIQEVFKEDRLSAVTDTSSLIVSLSIKMLVLACGVRL